MKKMQTKRYDYIDTAKGIGIMLVVWSHMGSSVELSNFYKWGGVHYNFLYAIVFYIKWTVLQTYEYEETFEAATCPLY